METQRTFNRWIRRLRADLDLTQEVLAEQVGCSVETIRAFESGRRRPSRPMAERLADVLEVMPGERVEFLRLARAPIKRAMDEANITQATGIVGQSIAVAAPARLASLPLPPTALIGREAEQAQIARLLADPDCRLMTFVGPGGIGKTHLALQTAAMLAERFPDGAAFVPLAQVMAAENVAAAIANALGISHGGSQSPDEALLGALREREMLLVLDNLEHLLDATVLLAAIAREAARLRLLVTSRERLRLQGERVVEVGGLPIPDGAGRTSIERSAAVLLFTERASRAAGDFSLTLANRADVARICRLLDGMPLGIELAAAWTRALAPDEIVAELTRGLDFLTLTNRDANPRHRSMRVVIDYSWERLAAEERQVLARLAVFQGGCTREAAIEVAGATLPVLLSLIDKSLLRREQAGAATRFTLHELVRQYAGERLAADGAAQAATETRHTAYFAALLQKLIDTRTGAATVEARTALNRDIDNLRAAWTRAAEAGDLAALTDMIRGFWVLYEANGWLVEGATLFGHAAAALRHAPAEAAGVRGYLLVQQSAFLARAGGFDRATPLLEEGMALVQASEAVEGLSDLTFNLGIMELQRAQITTAQALLASSAAAARAAQDHFIIVWAGMFLGWIAQFNGDYPAAETAFQECLALSRAHGFTRGEAYALGYLGDLARIMGRHEMATAYLTTGMHVVSNADDVLARSLVQAVIGGIAVDRGEWDQAQYLLAESATITRDLGESWTLGAVLCQLGHVARARGSLQEARQIYLEMARIVRVGEAILTGDLIYGLALLCEHRGEPVTALALLIALDDVPTGYDIRQRAGRLREDIERSTGPGERETAVEMAHRSPLLPWLESVIAQTLSPLPTETTGLIGTHVDR